jgi:hypothetical protein
MSLDIEIMLLNKNLYVGKEPMWLSTKSDSWENKRISKEPCFADFALHPRSQSYDFWIYNYNASVLVGSVDRFELAKKLHYWNA